MQYKETTGYFCKPDKVSTFRIAKGENSLIRVYYPNVQQRKLTNNNVNNNEEKQEYRVEIEDVDDDDDDDEDEAVFPDKLKYIYAITCLSFSEIKQFTNSNNNSNNNKKKRPNGLGTKLKKSSSSNSNASTSSSSSSGSNNSNRYPSPPPDRENKNISNKHGNGESIALDAIFVLNRDLTWHVLAYVPDENTFKIVLQGKLRPPYANCLPRNDGIVTMDAGFLYNSNGSITTSTSNMNNKSKNSTSNNMMANSNTPSRNGNMTLLSSLSRRIAVYLSIFNIPCITRIFIDCPKELLLDNNNNNNHSNGINNNNKHQEHASSFHNMNNDTLLNNRPATVTASENFNIAWNDPGAAIVTNNNDKTNNNNNNHVNSISNAIDNNNNNNIRILGVQHVPYKTSYVIILYQNLNNGSVYIRNAMINTRYEQLMDGPWFAGPLDPTTASFVDWPVPFNHLCIGNMSASLFNADGLAGYVEFNGKTRDKLLRCELDSLKQIYMEMNLYTEPFETAMPILIDMCHERYLHLMHCDVIENDEDSSSSSTTTTTTTSTSTSNINANARLRRTVGVINGIQVPLLMTSPNNKNAKQKRKRLIVASHGANTKSNAHLSYTEWGKGVDIVSEIRVDEDGFGRPDIFTTKDALFLSYRAENQTHVLPLNEDGEVYEYDPEDEYGTKIPSFYNDAPTLCVGRIENSQLTVQITTKKIGIFRDGEDQAIEEWSTFDNNNKNNNNNNDEIRFATLNLNNTPSPRGIIAFDSDIWIFELSTSNDPSTFLNRIHFTFNSENISKKKKITSSSHNNSDNNSVMNNIQISTIDIHDTYITIGTWNDINNIYLYNVHEATIKPTMQALPLEHYEMARFSTLPSSGLTFGNREEKSNDDDDDNTITNSSSSNNNNGDIVRSFTTLMNNRYLFAGTIYGWVYCFDLKGVKNNYANHNDVSMNYKPPMIGKWQIGNEVVQLQSFMSIPMIYASSTMDAIISFHDIDGCLLQYPTCDLLCRPKNWISSLTRPVASPYLDGSLIATVTDDGSLVFSTINHETKWQEKTSEVKGSITGLTYVKSSHIIVLTTDRSVQFWESDFPRCITVHESPNESRVTGICSYGNNSVAVAIFHDGVTTITLFEVMRKFNGNHDQQHENQQQKKTASVVINPIASGEIDGICLKLACNINNDNIHINGKGKPVLYAVVDEHLLHLKVRGKDISIGNVQRSVNGRSIMCLASSDRDSSSDVNTNNRNNNNIRGDIKKNNSSVFAAAETLGPIFAIAHDTNSNKTELICEQAFDTNNNISNTSPQRMVTAMKIISNNNDNDDEDCSFSWKIVAADRISNIIIILSPSTTLDSVQNVKSSNGIAHRYLMVEKKISSGGIRIASFIYGNHYFGGMNRNDVLLCVQNDGSAKELKQLNDAIEHARDGGSKRRQLLNGTKKMKQNNFMGLKTNKK